MDNDNKDNNNESLRQSAFGISQATPEETTAGTAGNNHMSLTDVMQSLNNGNQNNEAIDDSYASKEQKKPKLAEVKQFKKKEESPAGMTLSDAFRVMAENTEKGMFGTVKQFACVIDTVESGIVLIGPTDYAKMALVLQAGLQANIEDYMYGEGQEK